MTLSNAAEDILHEIAEEIILELHLKGTLKKNPLVDRNTWRDAGCYIDQPKVVLNSAKGNVAVLN